MLYNIYHWVGDTLPKAAQQIRPADGMNMAWFQIDLTPEEIVALSNDYDVLIQGARRVNRGTKKNPDWIESPPTIALDTKGRRFTQR